MHLELPPMRNVVCSPQCTSWVTSAPSGATYRRVSRKLWTDVRIFHCRPGHGEMLGHYFRRSDNLALDISLDIPFNIPGEQFFEFWGIILKIWSVADRWRRLCIITTADNFSHIQNNVGSKMAPGMESLQLRIGESESAALGRPALSFRSMNALKSLVLHGVTLVDAEVSSFIDHLEHLDLFLTPSAIVTQLAEHFDAASQDARAIPRLRHLSLRATVPQLHTAPAGALFKSYISSLTTLSLGNFGQWDDNFQSLCNVLDTPVLEELRITDLSGAAWLYFTAALSAQSLIFPALRSLQLSFIDDCRMHAHLAIAFPSLEHLTLLHVASRTFFSALSAPEPPTVWPHLRSLALDNADYRALRRLVEARIMLGCPLVSLEVDTPPFIDAGSLRWVQNHVGTLKRNVPMV
ncbi:hypothetical protein B0H14DRAFT_33558 [Mycena olivaceomarginata]|nr:hypothetical protein B0H14DRAFT_33558 [Mycena olivaceomarginata]